MCKRSGLYCNTIFVLQRRKLEDWKLYCNTTDCIARMCSWLGRKCIAGGVRLYCSIGRKIALQAGNCIATLGCWVQSVLQESAVARIVLQHNKVYCKRVQWLGLYCKTTRERKLYCKTSRGCWKCVAIQFLYCDQQSTVNSKFRIFFF